MSDAIKIDVEGLDECLRMFDADRILQVEKASMRKAAAAVSKSLRKGLPKRFKRLVKYKLHEDRNGNSYVLIGMYNRKEVAGNQPDSGDPVFDWFKAYWANYGTLSRRDPNHQFKTKIKAKTKSNPRRQSVGQPAQNFFERAIAGWQDVYLKTLDQEMKNNEEKLNM